MEGKIKIHLAQINSSVGDLEGNYQKILEVTQNAARQKCNLVIFPEMVITGYPAQDLWLKKHFIIAAQEKISDLILATKNLDIAIVVGAPYLKEENNKKSIILNSVFFIHQGEVKEIFSKKTLPNYGVFDEKRYFSQANYFSTVELLGINLNILVCEDIWDIKNHYLLSEKELDLIISVNSSPYTQNKHLLRLETVRKAINTLQIPVLYLNQVGGQDSILFDGSSFVLDHDGKILLQMAEFTEDFANVEIVKSSDQLQLLITEKSRNISDSISRNYNACLLALRDYITKNGFKKVLLGMSGGIDSALVATIAADALGSQNVALYALPTRFNSDESLNDALNCAKNLDIELKNIAIEPIFQTMLKTLEAEFEGLEPNIAEENMQSRIRGNILMALSNKFGTLLLSTGNKSELATGYATLYGDMCGAFNPIKDLYKTQIYELAKWRNENIPPISYLQKTDLIPQNIITKAPTAELRENQKDSDSLPEYDILDKILFALIEEEKSIAQIIAAGNDEKTVKKVAKLLFASQYKRSQSAIGVKISAMSFDRDYRYPLSNKFFK